MFPSVTPRWLRRAGLATLAAALLASCGGGTQLDPFVAERLLVFGDESSVIDDSASTGNGRKFSVNALQTDNVTVVCEANPLWIQLLAGTFNLTFPQCNPSGVVNPAGRIYAANGARVADIATQINTHRVNTGTGFGAKDLAAIMVGMHDVIALYQQFPTVGEDTLVAQAEAAGAALAKQVIGISDAGGRVLITTVPDIGLSPYARAQEAAFPGQGRQALITRLVARFNARLRTELPADGGRTIGLVLANEVVQTAVRIPLGLANVIDPVCDSTTYPAIATDLRNCTTQTLVTDGSAATWLWADDLRLSPAGHSRIGAAAVGRARGNPF
jgi:hypothetical protein